MAVHFIPKEVVLTIHAGLLQRYGGEPGLRDAGLLESALSQPEMTFGGKYRHRTLFEKAAAYGFHVCKNHPFVDGNKRVAFVLMDVFLQKNGWKKTTKKKGGYELMMDPAYENITKTPLPPGQKNPPWKEPRR